MTVTKLMERGGVCGGWRVVAIRVVLAVCAVGAVEGRVVEVRTTGELVAACQAALPEDEIVVEKGVYAISGKSRVAIAGRPGPVTVRGATGVAGDVVIEGAGQDDESVQVIFELSGCPRWTFRDLTTRNTFYHGFKLNTSSTDCVLRNVIMRDHGESGVKGTSDPKAGTYPDRLLVENCEIGFTRETGGTRGVVEGIDGVGVRDWVIRECRFTNIQKGGGAAYAVFTKGNSSGTVIEENEFRGCFIGASFGGGGTGAAFFRDGDQTLEHRGGVIRGNVFRNCTDAAIYLNKAADAVIEGNRMIACASNIELRYAETRAKLAGNTVDESDRPVVKLRDGAGVVE